MVCDALKALGVQCVTPESLRLAKVEDHVSSVPRLVCVRTHASTYPHPLAYASAPALHHTIKLIAYTDLYIIFPDFGLHCMQ